MDDHSVIKRVADKLLTTPVLTILSLNDMYALSPDLQEIPARTTQHHVVDPNTTEIDDELAVSTGLYAPRTPIRRDLKRLSSRERRCRSRLRFLVSRPVFYQLP